MPDEVAPIPLSGIRAPKPLVISPDFNTAEAWKLWIQQFQWYATAVNLSKREAEVQVATFMSLIGQDAIKIFNTFELSITDAKNLAVIIQKFADHFAPQPNESYVRFRFFKQKQSEAETFDDFLTSIKTQANLCGFGTLTESLIKDKIVFGIHSDTVRERLLAEGQLTLQKAIQICRSSEQAAVQLKDFNNESKSINVFGRKPRFAEKNNEKKKFTTKEKEKFLCSRCGYSHQRGNCPAYGKACKKCGNLGHFEAVCRFRKQKSKKIVHETSTFQGNANLESCDSIVRIDTSQYVNNEDWCETLILPNNISVVVKLDTGAQCNVLTMSFAQKAKAKIVESQIKKLFSFSNHELKVIGETDLLCKLKKKSVILRFIIVEENVKTILGKDSCVNLGLVKRIYETKINEYGVSNDIFEGLGCLKNFQYDIDIDENAEFKIHMSRRLPHSQEHEVKKELDKVVQLGVLKPTNEPTPAVSPLVIVRKNKKIRLCIDPTDLNRHVKRRHFPLKSMDEIAVKVKGAKFFTKLDCFKGFWQVKVTERTSKFLTIATPWGRYSFTRLPFGLVSAPEVFQKAMSELLSDIHNVEVSMDDILIYAPTLEELHHHTTQVMRRLQEAGLKLNKEKCSFNKTEIKFLGHLLTSEGLKIDESKVEAIKMLNTPTGVKELRFLGMVNYVSKFIPNFSQVTEPLRRLIVKDVLWNWQLEQDTAFKQIKEILKSPPVLAYYDVNKDNVISVDASSYAVGAVLFQDNKPVAYATKALNQTQQRYPQIEKEAFAIKFGCEKYHQYVYGKKLTVETDHKPLEAISKKTLDKAPARLQRLLYDIALYSPTIIYKKGKDIPMADTLSRDCKLTKLDAEEATKSLEIHIVLAMSTNALAELKEKTKEDGELVALSDIVQKGWPENQNETVFEIRKYWNFRDELSVYEGILFKNNRPIIPKVLHKKYLQAIHCGHFGIQTSLRRARESFFWSSMAKDVEEFVQACAVCQKCQRRNNREEIILKKIPDLPWQILATDFFHFAGRDYLVLADSFSGFFELEEMNSTTSKATIKQLKKWFATHGVPEILETNGGPQFTSGDFSNFKTTWNFHHQRCSPHYPQSNGLAERYVQTCKQMLRKVIQDDTDIYLALLNYRNAPGEKGMPSPAQRLFSRRARTNLPIVQELLRPKVQQEVKNKIQESRQKQKFYADQRSSPSPDFQPGDKIRIQKDARQWEGGEIVSPSGEPRSYIVRNNEGRIYRRNSIHLHKTSADIPPRVTTAPQFKIPEGRESVEDRGHSQSPRVNRHKEVREQLPLRVPEGTRDLNNSNGSEQCTRSRYGRVIKPPVKLDL